MYIAMNEISMKLDKCTGILKSLKVTDLVRDCLPVPPTPTSSALPRSCLMIRAIRVTCSMASKKNTSFISLDELML